MRAVFLCTLGAVLVWFAWHALSGSTSKAAWEPSSPGTMLPPEGSPAATVSSPGASEVPAKATAQVEAPQPSVAAAAGPAEVEPSSSVAHTVPAPAIPVVSEATEVALARSLVSDPGAFGDQVAKRSDLPEARRDLALAIGRVFDGRRDEARELAGRLAGSPMVRSSERDFLDRLLGGSVTTAQAASATTESPLVWAALLVSESREAESAAREGRHADAVQRYSAILLDYVRAPWSSDPAVLRRWSEALAKCQRSHRWSKNGGWAGLSVRVEPGDSLIGVRKRVTREHPELLLCNGLIRRVNELRGDTLRVGESLRIPTDRPRMVVDLDAHWAFFVVGNEVGGSWEIGVGRDGGTKPGSYVVGDLKENPMWFRQGQDPVPFGDPKNPLGTRWIAWVSPDGQKTGLGFHGTNEPASIGKDESQGCIRMRNEDVEELFEILPRGTPIDVRP